MQFHPIPLNPAGNATASCHRDFLNLKNRVFLWVSTSHGSPLGRKKEKKYQSKSLTFWDCKDVEMCDTNSSHLRTKITAKHCERDFSNVLHQSRGKCITCSRVIEHICKSQFDWSMYVSAMFDGKTPPFILLALTHAFFVYGSLSGTRHVLPFILFFSI